MATVPTFEKLLLEVHQSMGLDSGMTSKAKDKFRESDNELAAFQQKTTELLNEVFYVLGMDAQATKDACSNVHEWIGFHEELSQCIWTGNASAQQVTWHLLMYSYIPGLARRVACWSAAGVSRGVPMDSGMPGGDFWFLPSVDVKTGKLLKLPVVKVCEWLLDLVAPTCWASLSAQGLGRNDSLERTLQNWRSAGSTPQSAKKIDELFPIGAQLTFNGALKISPDLTLDEQIGIAKDFVRSKGMTAEALHEQLPMPVARLKAVIDGTSPQNEAEAFLHWLKLRYATPTIQTIRQRFKVARMMQDGCQRLLDFLVTQSPHSEEEHRRLRRQMLGLFHKVHNLSVEAYRQAEDFAAQDEWFESRLASWEKADLLMSIVPSFQAHNPAALLGERLSRWFLQLEPDSNLPDLVPVDCNSTNDIIRRSLVQVKTEAKEVRDRDVLLEKMRRSSPWRALQAVENYEVISPLAQCSELPEKWRVPALQRLRELGSAEKQGEVANFELTYLFALPTARRPNDMQDRVENILLMVEASAGYAMWKAPLLRLRGRHCLLQNDFLGAIKFHKRALDACKERQYGNLSGEIARDGWAIELAEHGFVQQNQERWYRRMLRDSRFSQVAKSYEDAAVWLWDFFDSELYQPYSGVERLKLQGSESDWKFVCDTLIRLSENEDWDELSRWMKNNAIKCRKMRLDPVRKDTVLMHWIKFTHSKSDKFTHENAVWQGVNCRDWAQLQMKLSGWQRALELMLGAWPEQIQMADFKGQTPLHLVADHGDVELTQLFAPLSDVNAQDVSGRTALHAATASRNPECVKAILKEQPTVSDKVSKHEGNTVLHTAVRFGQPACLRFIVDEYPSLLEQSNANGETPLAMARQIRSNWADWSSFMKSQNRATGSELDFDEIVNDLSSLDPNM